MNMKPEICWLAYTVLLTAVMWAPYILNSFFVRGIFETMNNPSAAWNPLAPWAQRAKAAHANTVENLVIFAPLVLIASSMTPEPSGLETLSAVFFCSRLVYFIVYIAGIPIARTVLFLVGFGVQFVLALKVLGIA